MRCQQRDRAPLTQARKSRKDHQDAHFDEDMATVVDRYDADAVRTVIQRALLNQYPFRTATVGLDLHTVDGVRISTAAGWVLQELNQKMRP